MQRKLSKKIKKNKLLKYFYYNEGLYVIIYCIVVFFMIISTFINYLPFVIIMSCIFFVCNYYLFRLRTIDLNMHCFELNRDINGYILNQKKNINSTEMCIKNTFYNDLDILLNFILQNNVSVRMITHQSIINYLNYTPELKITIKPFDSNLNEKKLNKSKKILRESCNYCSTCHFNKRCNTWKDETKQFFYVKIEKINLNA